MCRAGEDAEPAFVEQPPEPPVMTLHGFFPSWVQNEWAEAWRREHPVEAAAEAEWEAKILAYYERHGITPQPGQSGYATWLNARTRTEAVVAEP